MGTWSYQHEPYEQVAGCPDVPGTELSVSTCAPGCADITLRHPDGIVIRYADGGRSHHEMITGIHLPALKVPEMVEFLVRYSGADPQEVVNRLQGRP